MAPAIASLSLKLIWIIVSSSNRTASEVRFSPNSAVDAIPGAINLVLRNSLIMRFLNLVFKVIRDHDVTVLVSSVVLNQSFTT